MDTSMEVALKLAPIRAPGLAGRYPADYPITRGEAKEAPLENNASNQSNNNQSQQQHEYHT